MRKAQSLPYNEGKPRFVHVTSARFICDRRGSFSVLFAPFGFFVPCRRIPFDGHATFGVDRLSRLVWFTTMVVFFCKYRCVRGVFGNSVISFLGGSSVLL
ncbi:hypothetical protein NEOLEDRAFT_482636 [Neolentinus lepideus HHB14362 ss-1]|uniref:Uncharacterized protein n=1 Tax=Neolentinus lepideus HHB14362 ss-1 TaxID=1314782 RepID=A0A165VM08_9AGAM|nr:hypothetical protein NEOLEDRAFT_482636 [Neolentinus lepideus HHB14362 ss-1]